MNQQTKEYLRLRSKPSPRRQDVKVAEMKARVDEQARTIAALEQRALEQSALLPEQIYETGDYLQGNLHPKNWKALTNRRVAWPKDVDPSMALVELAPFMEYQILATQEAAQGRNLRDMIRSGAIS